MSYKTSRARCGNKAQTHLITYPSWTLCPFNAGSDVNSKLIGDKNRKQGIYFAKRPKLLR